MDLIVFILSCSALISFIVLTKINKSPPYAEPLLLSFSLLTFLWLFTRKTLTYCIFPGSLWIFKRSLEVLYSKEISLQVFKKLEKLKIQLLNLKINSVDSLFQIDPTIKKLLNTLVENLNSIQSKSKSQKKYLSLLSALKVQIEQITIKLNSYEITIWNWLEIYEEGSDLLADFTLTDKNKQSIDVSITLIDSIQALIKPSFEDKNCISRFFSFFFGINTGNLEYMRSDLIKRFPCETFQIGYIDSVYVKSEIDSDVAVMICNPNAGFYEFTYFQSEWLEFYLSRGINVILWNYRGYGISVGRPDINNIVQDGLGVLEFYTHSKHLTKIALHGESIGGYVAIQIAKKINCQFLLADRTFGCLSDVIKYSYGRIAYTLFKLSLLPDCENTETYLSLTCQKVLATDPNDKIIPDYVSLKSTVALSLLLKQNLSVNKFLTEDVWKKTSYVLTSDELMSLSQSLASLVQKLHSILRDELTEKRKNILKTETQEDPEAQNLAKKLLNVLTEVDSCGVSLKSVIGFPHPVFSLQLWIMTIEIWGSFSGSILSSGFTAVAKSVNDLKDAIADLQQQYLTSFSCEIVSICKGLTKVMTHLQEISNRSLNSFRTEDSPFHDYSKAGALMLVNCGHGGHYTNINRHNLEIHLINASFFG